MSRFDGYFLRQLLVLFCFFALVLVSVFWISRSVSLFDRLIGNGQTALVFLEFTALSLPSLVRTVMPMAVFGAAVYVTNRLERESELTVMLATGSSPWRLARPVVLFGLLTAVMMSVVVFYLRPASVQQLDRREAEVSRDIAAQLLREGSFMHPADGVTFYIGRLDPDGTLHDVFLSDRRDATKPVTYTGSRAFLVWSDERASLVMVDGMAQRMDVASNTLSTTLFQDFSYDITELTRQSVSERKNVRAITSSDLFFERDRLINEQGYSANVVVEELHQRVSWPLICVAVALVGFAVLLLGGFSRFGLWPKVLLAFCILIALEGIRGVASKFVLRDVDLWWLLYVPSLLGIAISVMCLRLAGKPLRLRPSSGRAQQATGVG